VIAAGIAAALLACWPSVANFPFFDDHDYISENETLRSIPLSRPWRVFTERAAPWEYLPLRDLSYRLDMALFGDDLVGYHLHNLLLYALCCLAAWHAVGALLAALDGGRGVPPAPDFESDRRAHHAWTAAAATLLFAVHPAHVEAVAWLSSRKDLLAGLFGLLALGQFARAIARERVDPRRLTLSSLCFAAALASKSTVMPLAGVALLLALARGYHRGAGPALVTRSAAAAAPLLLLALAALPLHASVASDSSIRLAGRVDGISSLGVTLNRAIHILGGHAWITLAPVAPRLTYDTLAPGIPPELTFTLGMVTFAAGGVGAVQMVRRRSATAFGCAFFMVMIAPVLQWMPFVTSSAIADRFVFLPVLGFAVSMAATMRHLGPRVATGAVTVMVIAGLAMMFGRSLDWRSEQRLWTANAEASPRYYYAQFLLIDQILLPDGRYEEAAAAAERVADEDAREETEAYVQLRALFDDPRAAFGRQAAMLERLVALTREGAKTADPRDVPRLALLRVLDQKATVLYMKLLGRQPNHVGLRFNFGLLLNRLGMRELAAQSFSKVGESAAADAALRGRAFYQLGRVLRELDRSDEAGAAFERATAADPREWRSPFQLALLLRERGDASGAERMLDEARRRAELAGLPAGTVTRLADEIAR
jgi:hypothetical protein